MDEIFKYWLNLHRRALDAQADMSRAWARAVGAERDLVKASGAVWDTARAGVRMWQAYAELWLPPK